MNAVKTGIILLTACLALQAFQVQAQDNTGIFLGAKQADISFDVSSPYEVDDEKLFTWVVGLDFGNGYTVELEKGEANFDLEDTVAMTSTGLDVETKAIYVSYRSQSKYFWKAKGGYLKQEATSDIANNLVEYNESGFSWGAGLGIRSANLVFELEYQKLLEDIDATTFGIHIYY